MSSTRPLDGQSWGLKEKAQSPTDSHLRERSHGEFWRELSPELDLGWGDLGGAGVGAGLAQTAQALDQHRRGQKGILAVDQVIEELVVGRWAHIEKLFNSALFGAGVTPPLAFEIKDANL